MSDRAQKRWRAFQRPEEKGTNYWRIQMEQGLLDSLHGYCSESDAVLAATAPELLEAAKKALRVFVDQGWDDDLEAAKALQSAIAKSEGGAE